MIDRYGLAEISKEIFDRLSLKYKHEIVKFEQILGESSIDSSNLEKVVEKGLDIFGNLRQSWVSGDFNVKQRLQNLVFPDGIAYDKKNDEVGTVRVNTLFAAIPPLVRVLEENKKGNQITDYVKTSSVPRTSWSSNYLITDLSKVLSF